MLLLFLQAAQFWNGDMTSAGTMSGLRHPAHRNRKASSLMALTRGQSSKQGVPDGGVVCKPLGPFSLTFQLFCAWGFVFITLAVEPVPFLEHFLALLT